MSIISLGNFRFVIFEKNTKIEDNFFGGYV